MEVGVVLTFAGVVVVALGALVGVLFKRISDVEQRVLVAEDRARLAERHTDRLWSWARALLDMYYRYRRDDSPDPPPLPDAD